MKNFWLLMNDGWKVPEEKNIVDNEITFCCVQTPSKNKIIVGLMSKDDVTPFFLGDTCDTEYSDDKCETAIAIARMVFKE